MAALATWLVGLPGPLGGSIGWANDGGPLALVLTGLLLASVLALYLVRDKPEARRTSVPGHAELDKRDATLPHAA